MGRRERIEFAPRAGAGFAEFRVRSGFFDPRQRLTVETRGARERRAAPRLVDGPGPDARRVRRFAAGRRRWYHCQVFRKLVRVSKPSECLRR